MQDGRWQVSTTGGFYPEWALNGQELFFRTDQAMMVAQVTLEPTFVSQTPELVFSEVPYSSGFGSYDIAPDSERFLMIRIGTSEVAGSANPTQVRVVQNWHEELKRLVPVN